MQSRRDIQLQRYGEYEMKIIETDERTQNLSGQLAIIFLSLTQVALLLAILYRRYILHIPEEAYGDLQLILAVSVFGYIVARILVGAHVPVVRTRTLIICYVCFVTFMTVVLSIWHGPPTVDNWSSTILPVLLGPAIVILVYVGLARLARKRMRQYLED